MESISRMPVTKIMLKKFPRVKPTDTVKKALSLMSKGKATSLPVFEGGRPVGEVNRLDLLKLVAGSHSGFNSRHVSGIMMRHTESIGPDATVGEAAIMMLSHGDSLLPVVSKGRILGIVTEQGIISAISRKG